MVVVNKVNKTPNKYALRHTFRPKGERVVHMTKGDHTFDPGERGARATLGVNRDKCWIPYIWLSRS